MDYKSYLEDKILTLRKRRRELKAEDPFADTDRLSDNAAIDTEAAEQFGHDTVVALKSETDEALTRAQLALSKIEKGTFGKCEQCGKEIAQARLEIDPTARYCLDCETKHEVEVGE